MSAPPDRETDRPAPPAAPGWLTRVPLPLRMAVYSISFLATALVLLPLGAYQLDLFVPSWHVNAPLPVRWLGALLFAAAVVVYVACSWWLTSRGRGAYVEFDPPQRFVSDGPFRWCRNPIAACVVVSFLGQALWWSSTGILLLFLIALPLAHAQVVLIEEPLLRRRFGPAYDEYLQRVPRWLPRPPAS